MLLMPCPENVHLPKRMRGRVALVESDLYKIAERIKEISDRLYIVMHENAKEPFVVMEHTPTGGRMVKRYPRLDASILSDLRYMLAVPFEKRFAKAAAEVDENNKKIDKMPEEKMEKLVHEMGRAMIRANIMDPIWTTSYPLVPGKKRKVAG